ncbi:GDP/GTP exchange factor for ARF [Ascosphaera atra]|nr:GDP/GTP exchange factor for ARF [Ascosphaera atra]
MPVSSVQYVVNTLLSFIPESSPSVITIKSESPGHSPRYHRKANNNGPVYDPAMLYCLEFATILTLRDEKTLECLGEALTTALQGILRSTKNYHQTIVARSISYLLETLSRSFDHSFVRAPVILHSISSFEQGVLETVCIPVMTGLKRCVNSAVPLRNEVTRSPDFWSILQRLHRQPEAAPFVFNLLQGLVKADPPAITADNYESAVSLANDFANAGSLPTLAEKNRDLSASGYRRNPKPVRQQSQP